MADLQKSNKKKTAVRVRKPRTVKLGLIGLGPRGESLAATLACMENVEVYAICDLNTERVKKMLERLKKTGCKAPKVFMDYRELIADAAVEGILVPTSWNSHVGIATEAVEAGKYVGIEVSGATSINELWHLVRAVERTGVSCMMLENCCYGRNELMVMNMVRQGLFGEIIYAEGGYEHFLGEMACTTVDGHERAIHNYRRCCDLYPTHQLGPISKTLDINRGNRFMSLTSTASKAVNFGNLAREANEREGKNLPVNFRMGDMIVTVIKCANGETVTLKHSVSLPRPYSRDARIQGTRGIWMEDTKGIYIHGMSTTRELIDLAGNPYPVHDWDPVEKYYEKYEHPIWREYLASGLIEGHGGIDALVLYAFVDAIRRGVPTPIDVYDVAAWMATTVLSEESIALGCMPVAFPDFTDGKWITRKRDTVSGRYAL